MFHSAISPEVLVAPLRVAVIIPCYRVTTHIGEVIARIGPEVEAIYCVDDGCPDGSGRTIETTIADERVKGPYRP